jgi:transcription-repair coupling factor (superfamily II helicase)
VSLYAKRQAAPGHAFAPDTPWQAEMEDAFGFTETIDQLTAITEVKADMEKPIPMDRVVCGDVGYGKTEIAVRAAFKAVQDGKQVAVLVPTTLLADQHLQTFTERMAGFPVTVKGLSRFTDSSESRKVLDGMADGSVDIVNMGAAGTPLTTADKALLTVDVWEHAYYIDYRNMRPKFVETFLDKLVNWSFAEANFA